MSQLTRVSIDDAPLPHLQWANGLTVSLPQTFAAHLYANGKINKAGRLKVDEQLLAFDTVQMAKDSLNELRYKAAFTQTQPLSSQLPMNYQLVPSFIRDGIAHLMGRIKRTKESQWAKYPTWPLDLSTDFLADLSVNHSSITDKKATPVFLTHDLDTAEGLDNLGRYFLDIEESVGARSCNYIVPCSWPINHMQLQDVLSRGHEIGIHGYDHSNKTPFLSTLERQKRLGAAGELINTYAIKGYRAPSLLRTHALLNDLAGFYQYDSSIPTSGGPFPIPNNGCASARPFKIGDLWELPLSMPRDGSLQFLGYSCKEILALWIRCANLIAQSGGTINLLTHCEKRFSGKAPMLNIYRQFLEYIAGDKRFQFMLPKDYVHSLG